MGYSNRDISLVFFLTDRQFSKTGIYGGFLKWGTKKWMVDDQKPN